MLRYILQIFGVALVLSGGLWTLQGLGLVHWPADSFMLDQSRWAIYGLITLLIGVGMLWSSRLRS
ncbi:hypothetical protein [Altererythrobacter sp. ZODW24]|uniref:hypothetical protein n=1 Tax=Altererythrobacter sp. ZODW24 TaxID=2185142 RepID=UPI000DF77643|nr:hypothetical protein [Altererythrobacter sp. ZODW24]